MAPSPDGDEEAFSVPPEGSREVLYTPTVCVNPIRYEADLNKQLTHRLRWRAGLHQIHDRAAAHWAFACLGR